MDKLKSVINKFFDNVESITIEDNQNDLMASASRGAVVKLKDGAVVNIHIKLCQEGSQAFNLNKSLKIFDREAFFYTEVLPDLLEFESSQKDLSLSDRSLKPLFIKSFGSEIIDNGTFIFLEKFLPTEYYVTKPEQFHTLEQIFYCMRSIALLHATSFCMKQKESFKWNQHPLFVDQLFDLSNKHIIDSYFCALFKNNLKILCAMKEEIRKKNKLIENCVLSFNGLNEDVLRRLERIQPHLCEILRNTLVCPENLNVITHGDFHMWNVAFSNKGSMDAKFFDFQLIRMTSGIIDVHHYLSQVCTPAMRNKHLHTFLETYYNTFQETCASYGIKDIDNPYTEEEINKEYILRSPWGFVFGFCFILPRFVSSEFYSLLEDKHDSKEIIDLLEEKGSKNVWSTLEVYVDMLQMQDDIDTIERMEKLILNL